MPRSLLPLVLAVALLAPRLAATWSIVLVDVRTGEIAIASATCLTGLDLTVYVPILVVGRGGAAAQSYIDPSGNNRLYIRDQLRLSTDPAQILAGLALRDPGHQTRQYGIVDVAGRAVGFSGIGAGAYAGDRSGRVGDIVYAIQGNVLTGGAVLAAAELALYTTPGDLAEKLMAAMEAARSYGGDGRCSCNETDPTRCGAPPAGFTKSADIGFMMIARIGDTDGTCTTQAGCANGSYYMRLNVANQPRTAADPVLQLRSLFDAWKLAERGRPDHFLSTVTLSSPGLPIDGRTSAVATVVLRDREGVAITRGGAAVSVALDPSSTAIVGLGAVRDHGDGTYSFPVTAGTAAGIARIAVTVDDGSGARRLGPLFTVPLVTDRLWASRTGISARRGGRIDFALQPGVPLGAGRVFVLLASMSGTRPGVFIPPFYVLPLNPDALFVAALHAAFSGTMPELVGRIPPSGASATSIRFPPGMYSLPVGRDLSFAYALVDPVTLTSNAVTLRIAP